MQLTSLAFSETQLGATPVGAVFMAVVKAANNCFA